MGRVIRDGLLVDEFDEATLSTINDRLVFCSGEWTRYPTLRQKEAKDGVLTFCERIKISKLRVGYPPFLI